MYQWFVVHVLSHFQLYTPWTIAHLDEIIKSIESKDNFSCHPIGNLLI